MREIIVVAHRSPLRRKFNNNKKMISRLIPCFLLALGAVSAGTPIPETISVGSYAVSLTLPRELWQVQVFQDRGAIRYSYAGTGRESFQLTVYRVGLPSVAGTLETSELVKDLVLKDGLKFKRAEFGMRMRLPAKPDLRSCPAGTAYVFASLVPSFSDPSPHFAAAALILPPDHRTRKIGFLVVGHQIGGGEMRLEQLEYLHGIVDGLRETPQQSQKPAS